MSVRIIKIKELWYNRVVDADSEDYDIATVGKNGVVEITEHPASGDGDKWYYDIHSEKGEIGVIVRTFSPHQVRFELRGDLNA